MIFHSYVNVYQRANCPEKKHDAWRLGPAQAGPLSLMDMPGKSADPMTNGSSFEWLSGVFFVGNPKGLNIDIHTYMYMII